MAVKLDQRTIELILDFAQAPAAQDDFAGLKGDPDLSEFLPFVRRLRAYMNNNRALFGSDHQGNIREAVRFFGGQTGPNVPMDSKALTEEAWKIAKEKREADPRWQWAIAKRRWLRSNDTATGVLDEKAFDDYQGQVAISEAMISGLEKYHLAMAFGILGQRAFSKLDWNMEIPNRVEEVKVLAAIARHLSSEAGAILSQARLDDDNRRKFQNRPDGAVLRAGLKTMELLSRLRGDLSDDRYDFFFDSICDEFELGRPGYLGRSLDHIEAAIREIQENR